MKAGYSRVEKAVEGALTEKKYKILGNLNKRITFVLLRL